MTPAPLPIPCPYCQLPNDARAWFDADEEPQCLSVGCSHCRKGFLIESREDGSVHVVEPDDD